MRYDEELVRTKRYYPLFPIVHAPLSFSVLIVYVVILALVVGFGSAFWALTGAFPLGREKAGAWSYWPDVGSESVDPYALAMINRDAMLPLGGSEGMELLATRDTAGNLLNTDCSYRVGATMPRARFWTLTAYGAGGGFMPDAGDRSGFTSSDIIRNEDGSFAIMLSHETKAGNWLPLTGQERFVLVLRLYDVPAAAGRITVEPQLLPQIERLECLP